MELLDFKLDDFLCYVTHAGLKTDGVDDLLVLYSRVPCVASACFTQNAYIGEPLKVGKKHIQDGLIQSLVVNSKFSNVGTGIEGYNNAIEICQKVGTMLNHKQSLVFPSSTGVIGVSLPQKKILDALDNISLSNMSALDLKKMASAIMTTDRYPKYKVCKIGNITIAGIAKGAGMVEPNMATMLTYFFTDYPIEKSDLDVIFARVIDKTFNCTSIDSDTSTSDTALIMSSGTCCSPNASLKEFEAALHEVALFLAKEVIRNAEGATKLLEVNVTGANTTSDARKIAKSIINSPLVKTAIYKGDPNWGRILMAIGKTKEVVLNNLEKVKIMWGVNKISLDDLDVLAKYLKENDYLHLYVELAEGTDSSIAYGCDLTEEYIRVNAYYTT